MSANPYWPRWIRASIGRFFQTATASLSLPLLIDGIDERQAATMRVKDRLELRVQGPSVREWDDDNFTLSVGINLMLTHQITATSNAYKIIDDAGSLQISMQEPIPLYKLGDGVDDDQSHFGCLTLTAGSKDAVQFYDFGQVGEDDRVRQLMLDATYYVDLQTRG